MPIFRNAEGVYGHRMVWETLF